MSRALDLLPGLRPSHVSGRDQQSPTGSQPQWGVCRYLPASIGTAGPDGGGFPADVLMSTDDRPVQWSPGDRFHDIFDDRCSMLGNRARRQVAVDFGEYRYTYRELQTRSLRLAQYLRDQGIAPVSGSGCCSTSRSTRMHVCSHCRASMPPTCRSTRAFPMTGSRSCCAIATRPASSRSADTSLDSPTPASPLSPSTTSTPTSSGARAMR